MSRYFTCLALDGGYHSNTLACNVNGKYNRMVQYLRTVGSVLVSSHYLLLPKTRVKFVPQKKIGEIWKRWLTALSRDHGIFLSWAYHIKKSSGKDCITPHKITYFIHFQRSNPGSITDEWFQLSSLGPGFKLDSGKSWPCSQNTDWAVLNHKNIWNLKWRDNVTLI